MKRQAQEAQASDNGQPWAATVEDVLDGLSVARAEGLTAGEVKTRRKRYGRNQLRSAQRRSTLRIAFEQFRSLIVLLLVVAAALSFAFAEWVEGIAIVVVIVINAAIGFVTELRAVRSMEALQQLGSVEAKVRREGEVTEVPAEQLVPGDIVILNGGDVVTADMRIIEASRLQANESALTGESVPVSKQTEPATKDAVLAERFSMVYKGTAITRGAAEGVVVATGMATELGRITSLVEEAEEEATPLEQRLEQLGHRLIWVTLAAAALVIVAGIVAGRDTLVVVETGIALAVASVPEGLPIVSTVAMARGMWRMARRNALINRLSAVETLGATTVILTDKTGTLTENQMTVVHLAVPGAEVSVEGEGMDTEGRYRIDGETVEPTQKPVLRRALQVAVMCNNAELSPADDDSRMAGIGDPLEVALLVAGRKAGLSRETVLEGRPERREVAFDPETKMMATVHEVDGGYVAAVKGAPEAVLGAATKVLDESDTAELESQAREYWNQRNQEMAREGLRVVALAEGELRDVEADPYTDLRFLGLVGLLDPPREQVRSSIEEAQGAGVRVVMVTGDQSPTARNVAQAVGLLVDGSSDVVTGKDLGAISDMEGGERGRLLDSEIFARVSPEQKLDLIAAHQAQGEIVAMTGDGVNDAPALKKADIGIAMGQRGTQVAREAADMVLEDDAFSTIVVAIEQGRVIFGNIRKFVLYLLSCNSAEVLIVALASIVNAPLPIRPLQILFLNVVTDVFPALALGVGEGDPGVMRRSPRDPEEPIMTGRHWVAVGAYGLLITVAVLGAFAIVLQSLGMRGARAVTVSFLALALAQLWHVFNMRDPGSHIVRNDVVRNRYVWGALGLCAGLLAGAIYIPPVANVLGVVNPGAVGWLVAIGASLVPLVVGQIASELQASPD